LRGKEKNRSFKSPSFRRGQGGKNGGREGTQSGKKDQGNKKNTGKEKDFDRREGILRRKKTYRQNSLRKGEMIVERRPKTREWESHYRETVRHRGGEKKKRL